MDTDKNRKDTNFTNWHELGEADGGGTRMRDLNGRKRRNKDSVSESPFSPLPPVQSLLFDMAKKWRQKDEPDPDLVRLWTLKSPPLFGSPFFACACGRRCAALSLKWDQEEVSQTLMF